VIRAFRLVPLLGAALLAAFGQSAAPRKFETADVKVSKPGTAGGAGYVWAGHAEFRGATMLNIVASAYGVEESAVIGGPSWLATDRFDITAQAASASEDETRAMLQALLAERFALKVHTETRDLPVLAFRVSKGGAKLKEAKGSGDEGCVRANPAGTTISWECRKMTIAALVERLQQTAFNYVDRPVVDLTGLKGAYDFELSWTARGQLRPGGSTAADDEPGAGLTLFAALEKQLGLELAAETRPGTVVVVEHVDEKPTEVPGTVTRNLPPAPTEFDVASIHPSAADETPVMRVFPSGQMDLRSMTLQQLIMIAYDVEADGIAGAPKWLDADRFDITAKGPEEPQDEVFSALMRSLLAERFKLRVHNDVQPVSVYGLTKGSGAPKLKAASADERADCTVSMGNGVRIMTCRNATMALFAEKLRQFAPGYLKEHVVDLTELTGAYDFTLSWTPTGRGQGAAAASQPPGNVPAASEPTGAITPFEAVDKQLGLKLSLTKHPMPVVVIDHVERTPTEN